MLNVLRWTFDLLGSGSLEPLAGLDLFVAVPLCMCVNLSIEVKNDNKYGSRSGGKD